MNGKHINKGSDKSVNNHSEREVSTEYQAPRDETNNFKLSNRKASFIAQKIYVLLNFSHANKTNR